MSRHNRRQHEEEEYEEEDASRYEEQEEISEEEAISDEPRRSLRPAELMFSTTGRLALGIFGVLLLIGVAAALRPFFLKEKPAVTADKSKAAEKKAPEKKAASTSSAVPRTMEDDSPETPREEPAEDPYAAPVEEPAETPNYENPLRDQYASPQTPANPNEFWGGYETAAPEDPYAAAPEAAEGLNTQPASPITPVVSTEQAPLQRTPTTAALPTRTYRVQAGESLFDIARYELSDASRWIEIYELNATQLDGLEDQIANLPGNTALKLPVK